MNVGITFTWWSCHEPNAGIEQVLPRQLQLSVSSTEHFRKYSFQVTVYLVKGRLESRSRFPVYAFDGRVQRIERIYKIGVLLI